MNKKTIERKLGSIWTLEDWRYKEPYLKVLKACSIASIIIFGILINEKIGSTEYDNQTMIGLVLFYVFLSYIYAISGFDTTVKEETQDSFYLNLLFPAGIFGALLFFYFFQSHSLTEILNRTFLISGIVLFLSLLIKFLIQKFKPLEWTYLFSIAIILFLLVSVYQSTQFDVFCYVCLFLLSLFFTYLNKVSIGPKISVGLVFLGILFTNFIEVKSPSAMEILLFIASSILIMVCLLVGYYLTLKIVQLKEASVLRKLTTAKVSFNCPSCAEKVQPVHCKCPSCKKPHKLELKPNQYGIYHHNCSNCPAQLPTEFLKRQTLRMKLFCPYCTTEISNKLAIQKHFLLVNPYRLKKWELSKQMQQFLKNEYQATVLTNKRQRRNEVNLLKKFLSISGNSTYPYHVHLHDIKLLKNDTPQYPYFKNANSILFVVPYLHNGKKTPLENLRSLLQIVEKYNSPAELKQIDFNIILAKTEESASYETLINKDSRQERNELLKRFVQENIENGDAFIHHIKQQFKSIDFYAVDAVGDTDKPTINANDLRIMMTEVCSDIDVNI